MSSSTQRVCMLARQHIQCRCTCSCCDTPLPVQREQPLEYKAAVKHLPPPRLAHVAQVIFTLYSLRFHEKKTIPCCPALTCLLSKMCLRFQGFSHERNGAVCPSGMPRRHQVCTPGHTPPFHLRLWVITGRESKKGKDRPRPIIP